MDVVGHKCGIRYSQNNPHRTLEEVFEFEKQQSQEHEQTSLSASLRNKDSPTKNKSEKKIC